MAARIFGSSNYIYVDDDGVDEILADIKSDVKVHKKDNLESSTAYVITSPKIGTFEIELADIQDETGTPYTLNSWILFYENNTGFSSALGGSKANQIIVNQANANTTLGGSIDSTKEYFIDGVIDMGVIQITVPSGGLNIRGYTMEISGLMSSEGSYTMFISDVGGSGDIIGQDFFISVTGTSSQVYDISDVDGTNAIEVLKLNYNDCTSLGTIDGYRQGLETDTGRFGGTPTLTLSGNWAGGYRLTTSIVRGLDSGMTGSIFEAGGGFVMSSIFLTDINLDLPSSASFLDFTAGNFPNPSTLQLHGCLIARNSVLDAEDPNILPNIDQSELPSEFIRNQGIKNTFVGGVQRLTTEVTTAISSPSTFVDLAGTWTPSGLEHFDAPVNGQLRHLGNNPREFILFADFIIGGTAGNEIEVNFRMWDDSASTFIDLVQQRREILSLTGPRDVAIFTMFEEITLDKNDYIFSQCGNNSGTNNITLDLDSKFTIEER